MVRRAAAKDTGQAQLQKALQEQLQEALQEKAQLQITTQKLQAEVILLLVIPLSRGLRHRSWGIEPYST